MISDEPDEDADTLDDEGVMDTCFDPDAGEATERTTPKRPSDATDATRFEDWPPSPLQDLELNLEVGTRAWFKAKHADWRSAMEAVLRSWIESRTSIT
jgi:hypothetical protein